MNEIKSILVTFFNDGTKGDYLEALNKAIKEIEKFKNRYLDERL